MSIAELEREVAAEERLAEELHAFTGQYVAVRAHEVVAHALTLRDLLEAIEDDESVEGVFQVPSGETTACFF